MWAAAALWAFLLVVLTVLASMPFQATVTRAAVATGVVITASALALGLLLFLAGRRPWFADHEDKISDMPVLVGVLLVLMEVTALFVSVLS
ncbi:MAG: hypothetical protein M3179_14025 [Actinomycetota bacterium]|nr:hypothetical protein [Actinomycetota bacterium]